MELQMTSPVSARFNNFRAFTLIELLVVIGIMAILVGVLVPAVIKAYKGGANARIAGDMQSIAMGLEAYKQDFGDYPRSDSATSGAQILCKALVAPSAASVDGADGNGFRLRAGGQGRIYGPYIPVDKFKIDSINFWILDSNGNPILYYPLNRTKPDITTGANYVGTGTSAWVRSDDNTQIPEEKLRMMLGDSNSNGSIDGGETAASIIGYLLYSAGPDGLFGPLNVTAASPAGDIKKAVSKCDDYLNVQK